MDPFWAAIADVWWIGPAVVGLGGMAAVAYWYERVTSARRLEVDAARLELQRAKSEAARTRHAVRISRTELRRVDAERKAGRAASASVGEARMHLQRVQREAKAATATVRARQAQLAAARATLARAASDPSLRPLDSLMAAHDAVIARWMEYETDPARLISFPAMSDVRVATTAAFLKARDHAQSLRPASTRARVTLAEYAAYRDAVHELERAFGIAEREAWRLAGAKLPDASASADSWADAAQEAIARSADAITRATEAAAQTFERLRDTWAARPGTRPGPDATPTPEPPRAAPSPAPASPPPAPPREAAQPGAPVWPVPARGSRPPQR